MTETIRLAATNPALKGVLTSGFLGEIWITFVLPSQRFKSCYIDSFFPSFTQKRPFGKVIPTQITIDRVNTSLLIRD